MGSVFLQNITFCKAPRTRHICRIDRCRSYHPIWTERLFFCVTLAVCGATWGAIRLRHIKEHPNEDSPPLPYSARGTALLCHLIITMGLMLVVTPQARVHDWPFICQVTGDFSFRFGTKVFVYLCLGPLVDYGFKYDPKSLR